MRIFGFDLAKFVKKNLNKVANKDIDIELPLLPLQMDIPISTSIYSPSPVSMFPFKIKEMAINSDVYRTILNALSQEVFRKGFEIEKEYESKCSECGTTYDFKNDKCERCGNICYEPNILNREMLEDWITKKVNPQQKLVDLLAFLEDDLNIFDNCYLFIEKNYKIVNGKIHSAEIVNLWRADPIFIRKLVNSHGQIGYLGKHKIFVCPIHRDFYKYDNSKNCERCGSILYPAHYTQVGYAGGVNSSEKPVVFYLEGEIIHKTKFTRTMGAGIPPILTLYRKVTALIHEDEYLMKMFSGKKPPSGILLVNHNNRESFSAAWKTMIKEATSNPHMIFPLILPPNADGNKVLEYVDFIKSFQDLEFIQHRNEFRRAIGSFFGVLPLFMGDTSASGGLNNERLQIVVTNRAIERAQAIHNDILSELSIQLGIDGWSIKLLPSEDRNEMNELKLEQQKLQNALLYKQLGYRAILNPDGEFSFEYDESLNTENKLNEISFDEEPLNELQKLSKLNKLENADVKEVDTPKEKELSGGVDGYN